MKQEYGWAIVDKKGKIIKHAGISITGRIFRFKIFTIKHNAKGYVNKEQNETIQKVRIIPVGKRR